MGIQTGTQERGTGTREASTIRTCLFDGSWDGSAPTGCVSCPSCVCNGHTSIPGSTEGSGGPSCTTAVTGTTTVFCRWTNDGECDETSGLCPAGSDSADCGGSSPTGDSGGVISTGAFVYCYVDPGTCPDGQDSTHAEGDQYSFEACEAPLGC